MNELGKTIKEARHKRGMSVRDLAAALCKSPGYISHVENGEIPSAEFLCQLATSLGIDPEILFGAAKDDALRGAEKRITEKQSKALSLFRKSK